MSDPLTLRSLIRRAGAGNRVVATQDYTLPLQSLQAGSSFAGNAAAFRDRSVILKVRDMAKAAAALIELDGLARRIFLSPPGWDAEKLAAAAQDIEADALACDDYLEPIPFRFDFVAPVEWPVASSNSSQAVLETSPQASLETEWVLPTSGTSGRPKLAVHNLRTLVGAIGPASRQEWATFYDIRRYGGLQIFLRALAGEGSLQLSGMDESAEAFLNRISGANVTHISGTPTHWRRVMMSGAGRRIDPGYVRLSGEIADDAALQGLAELYPRARVEHAYASTEAGVVFTVGDGHAGFPADLLDRRGDIEMKVVDGALRVRSPRRALRLIGEDAPRLVDEDGFVDTGDMIEQRGERCLFVGRRGGIINIGGAKAHPEEIEAALNAHEAVSASRAFARKNPITGALVMADVVLRVDPLREGEPVREGLNQDILAFCRARLPAYMVPVRLRFVSDLPMTDAGKMVRHG